MHIHHPYASAGRTRSVFDRPGDAILGETPLLALKHLCCHEGTLNLTYLALNFSHYVNGVAMRHGEVSRAMFGGYVIDAITNGVHAATWTANEFHKLFDRHIPGWRRDNFSLRYALSIPREEIWQAHKAAKRHWRNESPQHGVHGTERLHDRVRAPRDRLQASRPAFRDVDRLGTIAVAGRRLQIVYAGKAHPRDDAGKQVIERIFKADGLTRPTRPRRVPGESRHTLGQLLTSGVDSG